MSETGVTPSSVKSVPAQFVRSQSNTSNESDDDDDDTLAAYAVRRQASDQSLPEHIDMTLHHENEPNCELSPRSETQAAAAAVAAAATSVQSEQALQQASNENIAPLHLKSVSLPKKSADLLAKKEILTAQIQCYDHCTEEDALNWRRQNGAYRAVYQRIISSQKTSANLHIYLADRLKRLEALFVETESDTQFGSQEIGTLHEATVSLERLTKSGHQQFVDARDGVFKNAINKFSKLEKKQSKKVVSLREQANQLSERVSNSRSAKEKAWELYVACMREALLSEAEGRATPRSKDPYLDARKYLHKLSLLKEAQLIFSTQMHKVVEEFKIADARRISHLKDILLDHLVAEKTIVTNKLRLLDESLCAVKRIDKDRDVAQFIASSPFLVPNESGQTAFDVESVSLDNQRIIERLRSHVVFEAPLSRPGKFFKSHWKNGYAVVTLAGFLHWFENKEDETPLIRISLVAVHLTTETDRDAMSFGISVPKHSFFGESVSQYYFKASDRASLSDWIGVLGDSTLRATPGGSGKQSDVNANAPRHHQSHSTDPHSKSSQHSTS